MAAPCVASEVAVSVKAENSITSHVAPLHHCVQVWVHTLSCTPIDLILEASPSAVSPGLQGKIDVLIHIE